MQVRIHRGTKEIVGTCVELISEGNRIIVDLGLPLNATERIDMYLPDVAGLRKGDSSILGVFISHGYIDHCELLKHLKSKIIAYPNSWTY
ncbi:hypothetical protein [Sunxiuqinia elliptica]|uniref:Metallo-beta-lactamase superfamily protein n=1 Tax=Sunxiuqinia elliptica TaxID=655355 RepID=A0A4R6HCI5_9BACT|nr:hypothetical protein [Sunxiuqinia elliptica]TDO05425.1 hypothetical protein DET52_101785 [Sunxiuqinia elliptica]TDO64971.1 hypothetical protein DET65_1344 [Sunxiuqinia elliptica]